MALVTWGSWPELRKPEERSRQPKHGVPSHPTSTAQNSTPTEWCTWHPSSLFTPAQTPLPSHHTPQQFKHCLICLRICDVLVGKKWMNDQTWTGLTKEACFSPRKSLRKGWECVSVGKVFTWHAWALGLVSSTILSGVISSVWSVIPRLRGIGSLRPASATQWVSGHPGLHETLP